MKVLFVYSIDDVESTSHPISSWTCIQFGISYISALLRDHGHDTRLLFLSSHHWQDSVDRLQDAMRTFNPGLVCFTAAYSQYRFIKQIAGHLKQMQPDTFLVIGGVHATLNPEEVIEGPFDALCVGEGEFPALELCGQLERQEPVHGIANLWIRFRDGKIERNGPREFLRDLDLLPFPDREMWNLWMGEQHDGELAVLLGRGCPYNCTYCSNHALRKVAHGQYVRMRSPENILGEIAVLHGAYPHRRIYLEVETITTNKAWTLELCRHLESFNKTVSDPFAYRCNVRVSRVSMDEELFIAFEKANFYAINIGLESGSERIRREVLRRNYSNEEFLQVVSLARKHGLEVYLYNMIGLPGETLCDHRETVLLNRECQPERHATGIFFPYPGTDLYTLCVEQGLLKRLPDTQMERRHAEMNLPGFSAAQIQHAYTWFNYRVYTGYKPRWKLIAQAMIIKVQSRPITSFLYRKIVQSPMVQYLRRALAGK